MIEADAFRDLTDRVRSGDGLAATELVRRYEAEIRRAIHVRLTDPRLRRLLDTMDICRSVMTNFFVHAARGEFHLDTPQQLVSLLPTMARNKLRDHTRRQHATHRAQCRLTGNAQALEVVAGRTPTP